MNAVMTVGKFVDDFGNYVFPYLLENFTARSCFYRDNWYN